MKEKCQEDYSQVAAEDFAEFMDCECVVCWLYQIAVGAAELRERLRQYEQECGNLDKKIALSE